MNLSTKHYLVWFWTTRSPLTNRINGFGFEVIRRDDEVKVEGTLS